MSAIAKELDELRSNWMNPPPRTKTEVREFPGSVDGTWKRYVHDTNVDGIGTVTLQDGGSNVTRGRPRSSFGQELFVLHGNADHKTSKSRSLIGR